MAEWTVLFHVAIAFWFVAGLLGRGITNSRARSSTDVQIAGRVSSRTGSG